MNGFNHVDVFLYQIGISPLQIWVNYLRKATEAGKRCLVVLRSKEEIASLLNELQDLNVESELSAQKDKHNHMRQALLNGSHYLITGKFFNMASHTAKMQTTYQDIGEDGVELVLSDQVSTIYNIGQEPYMVVGYSIHYILDMVGSQVIPKDTEVCHGGMHYAHLLAKEGRLHIHSQQAYGVLNHPRFLYFQRVVVLSHEFRHTLMRMVFDLCRVPYVTHEVEGNATVDWRKLSITGIKTYYTYDPYQGKNFSQWELTVSEKRQRMKVYRKLMKTFLRNVARTGKENFVWTSPRSYRTALRATPAQDRFMAHPYNCFVPNVTALAYMRDTATYMVGFSLLRSQGVSFDAMALTLRDLKLFAATTALSEGKRVYAYIPNAEIRQATQNFVATEKTKARAAYDKQRKHEWYVKNIKPKREAAKQAVTSA